MANYNSLPVLSKIKIGDKYYYLKDSDVRSALDAEEVRANLAEQKALEDAKAYTDSKIGSLSLIKYEIVTELPTADAEHEFNTIKTVYLKEEGTKTQDIYSEYICVKKGDVYQWEKIGDTRIDLSNYYTKDQVDSAISTAVSTEKSRAESAESVLDERVKELEENALTEVPQASSTEIGGIKIGHVEGEGEAAVKLDSDGKAYVNATQYSAKADGGLLLEGTEFSINKVSSDLIKNGSNTFIINGGEAAE